MSLTLKMIYGCLTGAWGGFIAWVLLDPLLDIQPTNPYLDALINGAIVGVCVGALTGGVVGVVERNVRQLLRGLKSGLVSGLLGGAVGLIVGEALFQYYGQAALIRSIGWAIFGVAIGTGEGVLIRSSRRILLGAIGGLVGGVLGSLIFVVVRDSLAMPSFSRALGFTVLGALIGLFVGLVPVMVRRFIGTLKVVSSGRNEGREILLDKDTIHIGRDDKCDLGLYGDKSIQACHAEIQRTRQGFMIRPIGTATIQVNGQAVTSHLLQKGDRVRIGREEVLFR